MVRYGDHITIYRETADKYDPFRNESAETLIYEGDCKVKLVSGYNISDKLVNANYAVYLSEDELPMIEERDKAIITFGGYTNERKCTVVEFIKYERNSIIYLMLVKDGDTNSN